MRHAHAQCAGGRKDDGVKLTLFGKTVKVDKERYLRAKEYTARKHAAYQNLFVAAGETDEAWEAYRAERDRLHAEYRDLIGSAEREIILAAQVMRVMGRMTRLA